MLNRIEINPNIHFNKPCIKGTRIPVHNILELVRDNISFSEIINNYYPDLTIDDIQACIQYAINIIEIEDIQVAV